jgi:hypothetical protein
LRAAAPTRLGVDAHLVSEWRAKGFHAVVPEASQKSSVLLRLLQLKSAQPLTADVDIAQAFTLDLDRAQTCATPETVEKFAEEHPLWGMPYALPGIEPAQYAALQSWIEAGAPTPPAPQLSAALQKSVADWEAYLNEDTAKRKLIARYLYEHLFLASLYFKGVDESQFFRLVRSRTPSGFPVEEIPTRRPFEDPGKGAFYYRVVLRDGARLAKTHMPYSLDPSRMQRYRELFDLPSYEVAEQPSYELAFASNPFRSFGALPVSSRYQFMLDEAEFFMMGFIKGPVCRGQVALNVIQDRFWIAFLAPDVPFATHLTEQLSKLQTQSELPAESGSNAIGVRWFDESKEHARYVKARNAAWAEADKRGARWNLEMIWDGDKANSNAGLTVFRHFDSASVVRGFVGGPSKTTWVVDYPLFERIHYLLVAGFDVFGNVGHQIMTRLYMDFLRMEAEANYLAFLPSARRAELASFWYRGVSDKARKRVMNELVGPKIEPALKLPANEPEVELAALLAQRLARVLEHRYDFEQGDALAAPLRELARAQGPTASALPEISFVELEQEGAEPRYVTLLRESAHSNVAKLFDEDNRRLEAEDKLTVVPGLLGAYPNAIFRVRAGDAKQFTDDVLAVHDAASYRALRDRFGVLRHDPKFWAVSDRIQQAERARNPLTAGAFDYNRLHPH